MKKALLFLFFTLSCLILTAQESLRQQIENQPPSKPELIDKARQLLLTKFLAGDIDMAKQLSDYIADSITDDEYIGLWPAEKTLIDYWANDYNGALTEIGLLYDKWYGFADEQPTPDNDFLIKNLLNKSIENQEKLFAEIESANLSNQDKSFLTLYLKHLFALSYNNDSSSDTLIITQEYLNEQSNAFIANNPDYQYNNIVKSLIRQEYVVSKWGWGLELFSGYGIFTGKLNDNFRNPIPFGISFDVAYTKFIGQFRIYCGFSKTKNDITFLSNDEENVWKKNSTALVVIPEFSLGYTAYSHQRFQISPFALVGATNISPTNNNIDKNPELEDADITSFTYGLGVNFDINFGKKSNTLAFSSSAHTYWFIRLRYSFNMNNFKNHKGRFHNITIGIGIFNKNANRRLD